VNIQAKSIIGKTITGVISHPASGGIPSIMVLQFSDGSCFEFVSPAAQRAVSRQVRSHRTSPVDTMMAAQLTIFPPDGDASAHTAVPAAAA